MQNQLLLSSNEKLNCCREDSAALHIT